MTTLQCSIGPRPIRDIECLLKTSRGTQKHASRIDIAISQRDGRKRRMVWYWRPWGEPLIYIKVSAYAQLYER